MTTYVLDAETNLAHDHIWMIDVHNPATGKHRNCRSREELTKALSDADLIIYHGGIDFDVPVISRVWGFEWPDCEYHDTLVMSRLWCPTLDGGHSLAAWGRRLGNEKGEFTDFDEPAEGETYSAWLRRMQVYMEQDTEVEWQLHEHLMALLRKDHCTKTAFQLEHDVARIVSQQMQNGMYFDIESASALYATLTSREEALLSEMQETFPPIVEARYSDKQVDAEGNPKRLKDYVEEFNPASRQQIAKRLIDAGVKLTERTETGQFKVDETILEGIDHPAAMKIHEYMMIQKRVGQLNQWFHFFNEDTHRIHGKVNSMGTGTFRMSQFKPNMAQVPTVDKPYGKECRSLWRAAPGFVICGIDAAGLELRCFANRVGDMDYIDTVVNGDVHQHHADVLGIDRRVAKVFIYAFLYGAGDGKLGQILGGTRRDGTEARRRFSQLIPGLAELSRSIKEQAVSGHIRGLDGRMIRCKSEHSALNYQLQSDGAIVMKMASVNLNRHIREWNPQEPPKLVVQAHDEWQYEVLPDDAENLGRMAVDSIKEVQKQFKMLCPLDGEYQIGPSWAETH